MYKIRQIKSIKKEICVPADKSISHRALMLSALSEGKTSLEPFLNSNDTLATANCLRALGADISLSENMANVNGVGMFFPKKDNVVIDALESGTTMRILTGILCAQKFPIFFKGADALCQRPMERVVSPLIRMRANITGQSLDSKADIYPPLTIQPASLGLKGIYYKLPIASAQVKSAVILAALYAQGDTTIDQPFRTRDHTERMLKLFKVNISVEGNVVKCHPTNKLISPKKIFIPSDFSSAAFFIVLGLLMENSEIILKNININPTRCGLLQVLKRMGGNIEIINEQKGYESYADIKVKSSKLKATAVSASEIPSMIDEIPILCVAAAFASGKTDISGVKELKVKETDRIVSMMTDLRMVRVNISESTEHSKNTTITIKGNSKFGKKANFKSFNDHRTAMSLIIFGSIINGEYTIDEVKCINKSFPGFIPLLESLR